MGWCPPVGPWSVSHDIVGISDSFPRAFPSGREVRGGQILRSRARHSDALGLWGVLRRGRKGAGRQAGLWAQLESSFWPDSLGTVPQRGHTLR
jgi:hypothetical protein